MIFAFIIPTKWITTWHQWSVLHQITNIYTTAIEHVESYERFGDFSTDDKFKIESIPITFFLADVGEAVRSFISAPDKPRSDLITQPFHYFPHLLLRVFCGLEYSCASFTALIGCGEIRHLLNTQFLFSQAKSQPFIEFTQNITWRRKAPQINTLISIHIQEG